MKYSKLDLFNFIVYIIFIGLILFDFINYRDILAYKDNTVPPLDYKMYFFVWDDDLMGHNILYRLPHFIFSLLSNIFGILIIQKIFMVSIFLLPFFTFYISIRSTYKIHPISAFISSFIFAINPLTIELFWGGINSYLSGIFYSIIPLVIYAEYAYLNEKQPYYLVILLLSISLLISLIPYVSVMVLFFIFIYFLITLKKITVPKNFGLLIGVIFLAGLLSINTFGFLDSRLIAMEDPSYDQRLTSDTKFAYAHMTPLNIISLSGNDANYFVYKSIHINNLYTYKWLYFGIFIFIISSLLFKRYNSPYSVYLLASILIMIGIILILFYVYSISTRNSTEISLWGIIRNPDKLYFSYIYFFAMGFAFSLERFLKNRYASLSFNNIILIIIFIITMIAIFFPMLGTYGGLDKFYYSDSIEKLSINKSYLLLPQTINNLNLKGRVAVLPYEITLNPENPVEDIQNILMPILPQVIGIRKGGFLEYNHTTITTIKKFYKSIKNQDTSALDTYSRILGVEAYIIRKKAASNFSSIDVKDHWQGAPYIVGNPENFLQFFNKNNYSIIFEDNDFVIFKPKYSAFERVYGIKINDSSLFEISPEYIVSNYKKVKYDRTSPVDYKIYNSTFDLLILSQSYNPNWIACVNSKCVDSENILGLNGFRINNTGSNIVIKNKYSTIYFWGTLISYGAMLIGVIYIIYWRFNHARREK